MNYLMFNRLADGGKGADNAKNALESLKEKYSDIKLISIVDVEDVEFLKRLKEGDNAIILGGDGTLNNLINKIDDFSLIKGSLYLYPSGTGNDFLNDIKDRENSGELLIDLKPYFENLPIVEVNGKTYKFLNGIGYGIDGDCCLVAENMKKEGKKDINYSNITINLLLKKYKPKYATVKVDGGEEKEFKKVYLASSMNGRYYGGGMMIAPTQIRGNNKLTLVVVHGKGKLRTLLMFPKIFKGTHVKDKKHVEVIEGKNIFVSFKTPCTLQIDGEVVENVTSYKAYIK